MTRLDTAIALFDDYNRRDPRLLTWDGVSYPSEYFYALQLHGWVTRLDPDASEALLLASRSQHIGRWQSPRETYPEGKAGYLRWRSDLKQFHADTAGALLHQAGYDEDIIRAVQTIIKKENLKTNPAVQTIENALCLVFLEFQYKDFLQEHDEEKMIRILRKSWGKMDQVGRDAALQLSFDEQGSALLNRALAL